VAFLILGIGYSGRRALEGVDCVVEGQRDEAISLLQGMVN
jgi:hypothetical protein